MKLKDLASDTDVRAGIALGKIIGIRSQLKRKIRSQLKREIKSQLRATLQRVHRLPGSEHA
jgi:hypothetical protein